MLDTNVLTKDIQDCFKIVHVLINFIPVLYSHLCQNLIQGEVKRRLNSGNVCYHSVQNLLSSQLLSKNLKITIYVQDYNFACGSVWV
jgi:hypothetical protein